MAQSSSFPEKFQYWKWLACTVLCSPTRLAWAALFLYVLLDDSLELHEEISASIAKSLDLVPALGLRAKDFGEIAVTLIAGLLLIGLIVICYRRSDNNRARALTWALLPWLGLLVISGLVLDMAHGMIRTFYGGELAVMISGVFEDGGEMIAASFLTATVARAVFFPNRTPAIRIRLAMAALPAWAKKVAQPANAYALVSLLAIGLVLLVMAAAIMLYSLDVTVKKQSLYLWLLREDGPIEEPTAILFGLAALFALIAVFRRSVGDNARSSWSPARSSRSTAIRRRSTSTTWCSNISSGTTIRSPRRGSSPRSFLWCMGLCCRSSTPFTGPKPCFAACGSSCRRRP